MAFKVKLYVCELEMKECKYSVIICIHLEIGTGSS